MALSEKRIQACDLRRQGKSINEIRTLLKISKSSASIWCRDIVLTSKQIENLMKGRNLKTNKGRLVGAEMNKQKRLNAIEEGYVFGKNHIQTITDRELILVATALYWAEGSKSDSAFGFQFINSDPDMVFCVKKFLVLIGINPSDIVCKIQINELHRSRIKTVLNFWQKLLELHDEQLGNPSFVQTTSKKVYENHDRYYGICHLMVRKSTMLKYKMLGLIKALKNDILSA